MEPTLIELVLLRKHCEASRRDLLKMEHIRNSFDPEQESVVRFFNSEYGIPADYQPLFYTVMGIIDKPFVEYLKILQVRMHRP